MIVIEVSKNEKDLIDLIRGCMNSACDEASIDGLDGNDVIQYFIPLALALTPLVTEMSKLIKDLFGDRRVTIKYGEIELSVMGYEKAMKMLKEIKNLCNDADRERNNDEH